MTFEADTLQHLTAQLRQHGKFLLTDVHFIRAPYRHDRHWICTVE
ncbi:hypothetical protein [Pseudomonas sp. dw_358]|nr:hypothetical protein [Pseudomonas sp. dw_358]